MIRTLTVIALILVLLAVSACGGGDDSDTESFATTSTSSMDAFDMDVMTSESGMASALQQPAAAAAPEAMEKGMARDGRAAGSPGGTLQFADRKIISTGNITVEVDDVESSVAAVEAIADGMGGYVEVLSRSGGDDFSRASLTIRVPQGQFASAYDRIRDLGEVLNEHQGSEDVSEQFIDLEARLKSALREEQSYLSLLGRTSNVSEVLAIERELARVRADIERYQGQLDFLSSPGGPVHHLRGARAGGGALHRAAQRLSAADRRRRAGQHGQGPQHHRVLRGRDPRGHHLQRRRRAAGRPGRPRLLRRLPQRS